MKPSDIIAKKCEQLMKEPENQEVMINGNETAQCLVTVAILLQSIVDYLDEKDSNGCHCQNN